MPDPITSTDNPLVKRLASLTDTAGRREHGWFLVEGRRAIDGFLSASSKPVHLLIREGLEIPDGWPEARRVSARVADRLSSAATPSGYAAAFPIPVPPALDPTTGGLVLAAVADPGNVGTLIRTAAALGLRQVVLSGGADPWSPKVVQASAGALALVGIHRLTDPIPLRDGAPLCALVVSGGVTPGSLPRIPRWLVVGGEADGVPADWLSVCRERLTLPMPGGTESLNAAIAGSIAAYWSVVGPT